MKDERKDKLNLDNEPTSEKQQELNESFALDDARRVRVLSPARMVMKRFLRNKLAITGLIMLAAMFIFAFIGGILTPYGQSQVFRKEEETLQEYASATYNSDLRYTVSDGRELPAAARSQMALAVARNQTEFVSDNTLYTLETDGNDLYRIMSATDAFKVKADKKLVSYTEVEGGVTLDDGIKAAFIAAKDAGLTEFTYLNATYSIVADGNEYSVFNQPVEVAVASKKIFDAVNPDDLTVINDIDFRYAAESAANKNADTFECDGVRYGLTYEDGNITITKDAENFALISDIVVDTQGVGVTLSAEFKAATREAIADNVQKFTLNVDGKDVVYEVQIINTQYRIMHSTVTTLIDMYHFPDAEHPMGTDGNGMDLLTRLMYGGRVSLMVGFVVILIELFIGVILGGVAGYFGGIVDTCIMRFVDLFNSLPYYPMMFILSSVLDAYKVEPSIRIWILMVLLGVMGWTGIARVVRGQILSLREQDFMVATEATGLRVRRRIFRHLVPNVMPLLIVQATMSLGGIIISEATLSFLGMGVKYPLASWGTIINAASNIHVMTNYWFIWVPAGILILITVLGFNFMGDGLRDAFDPKMKR